MHILNLISIFNKYLLVFKKNIKIYFLMIPIMPHTRGIISHTQNNRINARNNGDKS